MIDAQYIRQKAEALLDNPSLFVVEASVSAACEIEVLIDSDSSVSVDDCVKLSRALEALLDAEHGQEDFSLTVCSAGIGTPLKLLRQYRKLIGRPVEVLLHGGGKILATLTDATDESISVQYTEKQTVEGKKRKQEVEVQRTLPLADIKYTREYLDFK